MNTFTKIYLAVFVVTGISSVLCGAFASKAEQVSPGFAKDTFVHTLVKTYGDEAGPMTDADETFDIDQTFDKIEIEVDTGRVEIVPVDDGKKPRVRFSGQIRQGAEKPFGFKVSGGELEIEVKSHKKFTFSFTDNETDSSSGDFVTILELPKSWKGSIEATTISDDIKVGFFNLDRLNLKTVSGEVDTDWRLSAKNLQVKSVSGDLKLFGQFRDASIESVSGEVSLGLPPSGQWNFDIKTVSGDIQNTLPSKSGKVGKVLIKTISGDVIVAPMDEQGGSISEE